MNRFAILLLVVVVGCNPRGNITRTLRFVDLNTSQNQAFQQYPNEISYFLLDAVLKGNLEGFTIDYQTGKDPEPLSNEILLAELTDIFYDDEVDAISASAYLSLASLIGLDEIQIEGNYHNTNYITFYFPGDVTPEGMDRQFCSVVFQDALNILDNLDPPVVWFQYSNSEWGWINNEVFQPNYLTSNRLGIALLNKHKSDSTYLDTPLRFDLLSTYAAEDHFIFGTTLSTNGKGSLFFQNQDTSIYLGGYSAEHLLQLVQSRSDSLWIMPIAMAFEKQKFETSNAQIISENGKFKSPLRGEDQLSKKSNKKLKVAKSPFKANQKFRYRTVERIVLEDRPAVSESILDALRRGELNVYMSDTLSSKKPSGKFFDNLIVDDLENIKILDQSLIEVGLIVKTVTFDLNAETDHEIVGVGLIVAGKHVPEGFDRILGYFKMADISKFLNPSQLRGLPLESGTIETLLK